MAEAICSVHGNVEATWKEVVSKKDGKTYKFWSCNSWSAGQEAKCKVTPANTPNGKFNQTIDKAAAQMDDRAKSDTINRAAIIKSLIEAGYKPDFEAAKAFVWWLALLKDLNPVVKGMTVQQPNETIPVAQAISQSEQLPPSDEIALEDIPF